MDGNSGNRPWLPEAVFVAKPSPILIGGAINYYYSQGLGVDSLTRLDGQTGQLAWRYTSAGTMSSQFAFGSVAVDSAGAVYTVETLKDSPGLLGGQNVPNGSAHSYLIAVSGGNVTQRILLPTGRQYEAGSTLGVATDYDTGAQWGRVSIMPDGSTTVEAATIYNQIIDNTQTVTYTLYVISLHPDGTSATSQLQQHVTSPRFTDFLYFPNEVIPDGQGGLLVAWTMFDEVGNFSPHVTHVGSSGTTLDYPGLGGDSLLLGDNDTAFATNRGNVVAFGIDGTQKWTWQAAQNHNVELIVSSAGAGVIAKDKDQNGNVTIVRIDGTGNASYDTWPSTVGNLTNADYFVAGSSWLGYVPSTGSQSVYSGGQPVNLSASAWQQPDGAGANAADQDVSVTGFSSDIADLKQRTINDVLQRLEAALPLYPACNTWLQGEVTGLLQIQTVRQLNHYGHGTVQNTAGANIEAITAFSGSTNPDGTAVANVPVTAAFTVNDVSAFFTVTDGQQRAFLTGPRHYPGNSERTREFVLVHETAHQISVPGFLPDFGSQRAEDANNLAVDQHCRGLIEGPRIDRLRPNTGPVGTAVTITGHNFGTPPQGTTVAGTVVFNGSAQATPTSWSDMQIIVTVPAGATTGDMVVNVANKTDMQHFTIQ